MSEELRYTLFGESHGEAIGVVLEHLPAGLVLDWDFIRQEMDRRRARAGGLTTSRIEADQVRVLSGVFEGRTTGTPLAAVIENGNTRSGDYAAARYLARPSHGDYTGFVKYHGFADYRGGGHFSGRLTAPLVFAGALAKLVLREKGILVGGHILQVGPVRDEPFDPVEIPPVLLEALRLKDFCTISDEAGQRMQQVIREAGQQLDSVGGMVECAVTGLPAGIGREDADSMEGQIARQLFAVPAVKGVEFGLGFGFADQLGSQANDPFRYENGRAITATNHNGGINGGITNGMPLVVRTVVKPTPSIYLEQETVDLREQKNTTLQIQGRHDPAILHRARAVVDAVAAIGLVDLFAQRYGTLWMRKNP